VKIPSNLKGSIVTILKFESNCILKIVASARGTYNFSSLIYYSILYMLIKL
jgi:hypothetical protein